MTVALLDGDIIAFRASASGEADIDWGDGLDGKTVDTDQAIETAMRVTQDWQKLAGADHAIVCWTDRTFPRSSFRYLLHPIYKRHRSESDKPDSYYRVVEALNSEYKHIVMPRLEADDVMGIWATNGKLDDPVIVSTDKDMRTIPAKLVMPGKMKRPITISKYTALAHWMMQTLIGDAVDGYKGCPGIGEKKALDIIKAAEPKTPEGLWAAVLKTFVTKKRTLDEAVAEARMARILQSCDYNPDTQEIRLWHPTKPEWVKPAALPPPPKVAEGSGSTKAKTD